MSLLHGRLELGGVHDAEAVARSALDRAKRTPGSFTSADDFDDALAYVVGELWVAYERRRRRGDDFPAALAHRVAAIAHIDYLRKSRGRTRWSFGNGDVYERQRPTVVSLDERDSNGTPRADRLGRAFPASDVDLAAGCAPDFVRALTAGSSPPAGLPPAPGQAAARRAPG